MTEPTTAPCYDRGCLHYDHEEPPCVGHMPSICCAKLSAAIGAAAVADYSSCPEHPGADPMTEPTTEAGRAAALVEALTFLSTYEKDPPEVMKDDYAYDRLLAFVHDVAARALAAPAPTVSVSESPTHSWPCPDPDHTYPATPPTPALTAARERDRVMANRKIGG